MGNTEFFKEARKTDSKIKWRDILSESFRKHTKEDLDYTLASGTSYRKVSEVNMLQTWKKPWLWFPVLLIGLALVAVLFVSFYVSRDVFKSALPIQVEMICIIAPLVIPVVVMIFIWEINIPQNISVFELIGYFLIGGIVSIFATAFISSTTPDTEAYFAPVSEEPAKLIAGLVIVYIMEHVQHKKIYGITGLVIGVAVGAGFAGFETVQYAMGSFNFAVLLFRMLVAVGGHMVYSGPYLAALCLSIRKKGKVGIGCIADASFLAAFATSCLIHGIWNYFCGQSRTITSLLFKCLMLTIISWAVMLYWTRQCLSEIVRKGVYNSGAFAGRNFGSASKAREVMRLTCISGPMTGKTWESNGQTILIGRDSAATVRLSEDSRGVSRHHCSIQYTASGWTVQDLNASYGTFISTGRLNKGQSVELRDGELIYLGSKQIAFRVVIKKCKRMVEK